MLNNPIKFNDPTGHEAGSYCDRGYCDDKGKVIKANSPKNKFFSRSKFELPEPSGNNVEFFSIIAGISVKAEGYDGNPTSIGLLYFSVGVVTDKAGTVQFYYSTMDKTYHLGSSSHMGSYLSGPAERDRPSNAFGIGPSASYGVIFGKDFKTEQFLGEGYSTSIPTGTPFSVGYSEPYNKNTPYKLYSLSIGDGLSMGTVATNTVPIGKSIPIPSQYIPICKRAGLCGAYSPSLDPYTIIPFDK